jgi:uncharacterized membrane protein
MNPAPLRAMVRNPKTLAGGFALSGVAHLLAPAAYQRIVPRWLPRRRLLVHLSGVAELVCAAGLLAEAAWAGPASAALLVAVWPANVQMAWDEIGRGRSRVRTVALWARVPLQIPMIRVALQSGHSGSDTPLKRAHSANSRSCSDSS